MRKPKMLALVIAAFGVTMGVAEGAEAQIGGAVASAQTGTCTGCQYEGLGASCVQTEVGFNTCTLDCHWGGGICTCNVTGLCNIGALVLPDGSLELLDQDEAEVLLASDLGEADFVRACDGAVLRRNYSREIAAELRQKSRVIRV